MTNVRISRQTIDLSGNIGLCAVELPGDEAFLYQVYRSTRDDLLTLSVDDAAKEGLIRMQFDAQERQYLGEYPKAEYQIVLYDGQTAGRLVTEERGDILFGVDLALLPKFRNVGVGSTALNYLFERARAKNGVFRFHVLKNNRAARLYHRLGCLVTGETDLNFEMEWRPEISAPKDGA